MRPRIRVNLLTTQYREGLSTSTLNRTYRQNVYSNDCDTHARGNRARALSMTCETFLRTVYTLQDPGMSAAALLLPIVLVHFVLDSRRKKTLEKYWSCWVVKWSKSCTRRSSKVQVLQSTELFEIKPNRIFIFGLKVVAKSFCFFKLYDHYTVLFTLLRPSRTLLCDRFLHRAGFCEKQKEPGSEQLRHEVNNTDKTLNTTGIRTHVLSEPVCTIH